MIALVPLAVSLKVTDQALQKMNSYSSITQCETDL